MAAGIFLTGMVAYFSLPVSSLPAIDLPTIRIMACASGADPATMAASVAAPLERRLSTISGITELTRRARSDRASSPQFDLNRKIDGGAGRAIGDQRRGDRPAERPADGAGLPQGQSSAMPVLILALTSDTMPASAIFDAADTVIAQKLSQVPASPKCRSTAPNNRRSASRSIRPPRLDGHRLDTVANQVVAADAHSPVGGYDGIPQRAGSYETTTNCRSPEQLSGIVIPIQAAGARAARRHRQDRSQRAQLARRRLVQRKPAVLLFVAKQPTPT